MDIQVGLYETLFSTPVWRILVFLFAHPDLECTDAEMTRQIKGVRRSAVNITLRKLAAIGLVARNYRGHMALNKLCDTPLITYLKISETIALLQPLVDNLKTYCTKIILFGSRADGTAGTDSDFDLFVITDKDSQIRKILRKHTLAEKTQIIMKSPEKSISLSEDEPILYKQLKKGIVLWEK